MNPSRRAASEGENDDVLPKPRSCALRAVLGCAVLAIGLSGCKRSDDTPGNATAPLAEAGNANPVAPPSGRCKSYDACTVITPADCTAALGAPFGAATQGPVQAEATASSNEVKHCSYNAGPTGPRVTFSLVCSIVPVDPKSTELVLHSMYKNVTSLTGLGRAAYWGTQAGLPFRGQLDVVVGDTLLTLSVVIPATVKISPEEALDAMKGLVQTAIHRL
jgi:hypothetical protein